MFEKKAEEWADKLVEKGCVAIAEDRVRQDIQYTFRKGAEFGYNKCKEELNQNGLALQSDMDKTIEQNLQLKKELDKANEWHYVKDGDLPKEDLRQRTRGYYLTASKHKSYKGFVFEVAYFTGVAFIKGGDILDNVIAWKEIVLSELKESE